MLIFPLHQHIKQTFGSENFSLSFGMNLFSSRAFGERSSFIQRRCDGLTQRREGAIGEKENKNSHNKVNESLVTKDQTQCNLLKLNVCEDEENVRECLKMFSFQSVFLLS